MGFFGDVVGAVTKPIGEVAGDLVGGLVGGFTGSPPSAPKLPPPPSLTATQLPTTPTLQAPQYPNAPTLGSANLPNVPNLQAPQYPNAPTLNAPQLPQYPGLTPEQQNILQQQQNALTGLQGAIGQYGTGAYNDLNNQVSLQELQNYQNALSGQIAPNQMITQQKQKDWEALKQQAGQLGIQLSGNTPESAASQSTAGNQMIMDFNKRYGALEQNYNLGQQQLGAQINLSRLGLQNQNLGALTNAYGQAGNQASQLYNPYYQQQIGPWAVQTQQAQGNADIANQNLLNQYQAQYGQANVNANTQNQNLMNAYQNALNQVTMNTDITNQNLMNQYQSQYGQVGANTDIANQNLMNQYQGSYTQANLNNDIANQNALNAYQAATGQQMLNYQNAVGNYQSMLGLLGGILGTGSQLGMAYATGGASAAMPKAQAMPTSSPTTNYQTYGNMLGLPSTRSYYNVSMPTFANV